MRRHHHHWVTNDYESSRYGQTARPKEDENQHHSHPARGRIITHFHCFYNRFRRLLRKIPWHELLYSYSASTCRNSWPTERVYLRGVSAGNGGASL
jgi:hypothetical protein